MKFRHWIDFCQEFGFPVWIDKLSQERLTRIVRLFAGLCALEGHNTRKRGNKYQTFDGEMAAVAFAHRCERNARLNYKTPEFELVAWGFKRTNSSVDRKEPVTTPMLLEMHHELRTRCTQTKADMNDVVWGSILIGFIFLNSRSELWGPVTKDASTGGVAHCVKAIDVILRDSNGRQTTPLNRNAESVEIIFRSHKGDPTRQGTTIRHYRSNQRLLCPVAAAELCLRTRQEWEASGKQLWSYLTSINKTRTITKSTVAKTIKVTAQAIGADPNQYSTRSLRIGGACALLAAGHRFVA